MNIDIRDPKYYIGERVQSIRLTLNGMIKEIRGETTIRTSMIDNGVVLHEKIIDWEFLVLYDNEWILWTREDRLRLIPELVAL